MLFQPHCTIFNCLVPCMESEGHLGGGTRGPCRVRDQDMIQSRLPHVIRCFELWTILNVSIFRNAYGWAPSNHIKTMQETEAEHGSRWGAGACHAPSDWDFALGWPETGVAWEWFSRCLKIRYSKHMKKHDLILERSMRRKYRSDRLVGGLNPSEKYGPSIGMIRNPILMGK